MLGFAGGDRGVCGEPAYTACGATLSSGVMDSGSIFIWGTGILGIQESTEPIKTRIPKLVRGLPKGTLVRMVACGWEGHCFLVTRAGELWAWGSGDRGKLGLGDEDSRGLPTRVDEFRGCRVAHVSAGRRHSAAILDGGELFCWGCSARGQVGAGEAIKVARTPVQIASELGAAFDSVSCGALFCIAVAGSSVYAWGAGSSGQLGLGDRDDRSIPTVVVQGEDVDGDGQFDAVNEWSCVACGDAHSMVLGSAGELYGWGDNRHGQLGVGEEQPEYCTPQRVFASLACMMVRFAR